MSPGVLGLQQALVTVPIPLLVTISAHGCLEGFCPAAGTQYALVRCALSYYLNT